MLSFVDSPNQQMSTGTVLGKISGNLFTNKGPGAIDNLQTTVNAVMIRDRHISHPARFKRGIDFGRFRKAIGQSHASSHPLGRAIAVF